MESKQIERAAAVAIVLIVVFAAGIAIGNTLGYSAGVQDQRDQPREVAVIGWDAGEQNVTFSSYQNLSESGQVSIPQPPDGTESVHITYTH